MSAKSMLKIVKANRFRQIEQMKSKVSCLKKLIYLI